MELEAAELMPVVERELGSRLVALGDWRTVPIFAGDGRGLGVFRVSGTADVPGGARRWSLILKVLAAPDVATPGDWSHPLREVLAYDSGLLESLPDGLAAPRCRGHTEHAGRHHLWLEDLGADDAPWSLADYARAAHELGRFNGAYLGARAMPDARWLTRDWLRAWLDEGARAVGELSTHRAHPVVRRIYPPELLRALLDLWDRRETLLAALDRLPEVLCHQDAFRRNLFLRDGRLLAVDWAFVGAAPLGSELAPLVTASGALLGIDRSHWVALRETAAEAYLEGLAERGWRGRREQPEFGFAAASALRYWPGVVRLILAAVLDEGAHARAAQLHGVAFDEVVENWAALSAEQARLASEAFRLLPRLG